MTRAVPGEVDQVVRGGEVDRYSRSTGNNQNGRVQLGHALNWLLDHVKANRATYLQPAIEGVRTGTLVPYTNSSDSLNAINHNHHFKVDPDQAFAMWSSIDSIMRYVLKP